MQCIKNYGPVHVFFGFEWSSLPAFNLCGLAIASLQVCCGVSSCWQPQPTAPCLVAYVKMTTRWHHRWIAPSAPRLCHAWKSLLLLLCVFHRVFFIWQFLLSLYYLIYITCEINLWYLISHFCIFLCDGIAHIKINHVSKLISHFLQKIQVYAKFDKPICRYICWILTVPNDIKQNVSSLGIFKYGLTFN